MMRSGDGLEVLYQYGIKKQFSVEGVKREINKVQSGGNLESKSNMRFYGGRKSHIQTSHESASRDDYAIY